GPENLRVERLPHHKHSSDPAGRCRPRLRERAQLRNHVSKGAWHFAGALHGGTTCRPALRFQGSVAILSAGRQLAGRQEWEGSFLRAAVKISGCSRCEVISVFSFANRRGRCAPNKTASPGVLSSLHAVFSSSSSGCQWDYYR